MELDFIGKERLRRLRCWAQGIAMPPIRLELEPTDRCNLDCVFCWRQDPNRLAHSIKTEAEEISDDRLKRLVKEACDLGIIEWRIGGGGEPLLKRGVLVPMMIELKKHGVTGLLTTNGTLFSPDDIRNLVRMEWDLIEFSIDGPEAAIHDKLRGRKGAFEKAVNALLLFNEEKKKQHKVLPRLALNTVLVNENYKLIPEMIEMCHSYGIEVFSMNPITIFAPTGESLKLSEGERQEFIPIVRKAMESAKAYGISNSLVDLADMELVAKTGEMTGVLLSDSQAINDSNQSMKRSESECEVPDVPASCNSIDTETESSEAALPTFFKAPCFMPWYIMVIRGGMIGPCSGFEGKFPPVTDIPLADVWYGMELSQFRNQLLQAALPHFCTWCSANMVAEHRRLRQMLIDNFHENPDADCGSGLLRKHDWKQRTKQFFHKLRNRL